MKKQTWLAVALVAAAFGLGGYLLGGRNQQHAATRPDDTDEPRGRLETTGAPRTVPGVAAAPPAAADGAPAAPRAAGEPAGLATPTQDPGSPERRQRQLAILTDSYRRETADPRWAPGAESTIQLAAGPKGVGLKVLGVECHTMTCRAEIADTGSPQVRDVKLEQLAIRLGGILPSVRVEKIVDAPEGRRLVVYISRIPPM